MLQLSDISKAYVHQTIMEDVTLRVDQTSRIGLIGRNGSGKSTLLKIMMGEIEADTGTLYRAPGLRIDYLTQDPRVTPGNTLEEELKLVFNQINILQEEETRLQKNLASFCDATQMKALKRIDTLQEELQRLDVSSVDARISRMITGLGFPLSDLPRKVEEFSGGWQMRINLAKILLEAPDILLLDEPTNHLDLEASEWLESYLKYYSGGVIVVSHDRHLLEKICTQIAELELGRLTLYQGNYSQFLIEKEGTVERQTAAADRQQKEIAKQTAFVERFKATATKSSQAKSREKQISKIERIEAPKTDKKRMSVQFPVPEASGKQVLTLRKLSKSYGNIQLFNNVNADLQQRQRVFLLGQNGSGKTTLLRLILGEESPDDGEARQGHNVDVGYFAQNQLESLDLKKNVFDTLQDVRPDMTNTELRGLLGRLLFSGDQVFKPVSVLSGGEKSKLALAKLMLTAPNTLLLDEPSNHMDIPAKDVLEQAFREYSGTMLCISHDRYFIQQLATEIWELHDGKLLIYPGDYDYYLRIRDDMRARYSAQMPTSSQETEKPDKPKGNTSPLKERGEKEKQLKKIEREIIKLESEIEELQSHLGSPEMQQNYQALQTHSDLIGEKQAQLNQLNTDWEMLTESLID